MRKPITSWGRREFLKAVGTAAGLSAYMSPWLQFGRAYAQSPQRVGSADWSRYGYDLQNTRFNRGEQALSRENVERLKLKWSFEGDGIITTCPTVVGNLVFFATGKGYQYALNALNGELKWKFDAVEKGEARSLTRQGMRSSAQYGDGRLYFGDEKSRVRCLDAETGKSIWQTPLDPNHEANEARITSQPALYKGMVFIGNSTQYRNAQIACLDAETGAIRWRFVVVPESEGAGGSVWTSPAVDEENDLVFFGTGNPKGFLGTGRVLYSESILAFEAETGKLVWFDQARPADPFDLDYSCHPMVFDAKHPSWPNKVRHCVGAGNKAGFFCFDRITGERYWKAMLTNVSSGGGPENNSTAVAYNRVYVGSNATGPTPMSVSAALHAYTGDIMWWVANSAAIFGPLAVANGVLYQGLANGDVEARDAATGDLLWKHHLPSTIRGGIAIANGTLYVGNGEPVFDPGPRGILDTGVRAPEGRNRYSIYAFTIDGK